MIEVIIGLLIAFGITFFFEMQNSDRHTQKEYNTRYETEKKGERYVEVPYKFNIFKLVGSSLVGGFIGLVIKAYR